MASAVLYIIQEKMFIPQLFRKFDLKQRLLAGCLNTAKLALIVKNEKSLDFNKL